jgi:hypothetical protein
LTLLAGPEATWVDVPGSLPLAVHEITDPAWPESVGISAGGAVLVRPDAIVAWRSAGNPHRTIGSVVDHILAASE